ncbi:MAG: hypothetical protein C0497_13910 [Gemmatimonas sp.]|nr:hypothetical protein [Gemmatimonas sp.]
MRIVACITQAAVIAQILAHLRPRATAGTRPGARSSASTGSSAARSTRRQLPARRAFRLDPIEALRYE